MKNDAKTKYRPFTPVPITDRRWPGRTITEPPVWCSVDLRDGNQALITPMMLGEKLRLFKALCDIGIKEIEVGFPSSNDTEFETLRALIDNNLIPDNVTIQVLVQAREHLIRKTFEAIKGAKNVILHFYNSTSELQRRVVFGTDRKGVTDIAVNAAKLIKELSKEVQDGTNLIYEYSPESFSATECDFAVEICDGRERAEPALMEQIQHKGLYRVVVMVSERYLVATRLYCSVVQDAAAHLRAERAGI